MNWQKVHKIVPSVSVHFYHSRISDTKTWQIVLKCPLSSEIDHSNCKNDVSNHGKSSNLKAKSWVYRGKWRLQGKNIDYMLKWRQKHWKIDKNKQKNEQPKSITGIIMLRRLTIKRIESKKIRLFRNKKMVKNMLNSTKIAKKETGD